MAFNPLLEVLSEKLDDQIWPRTCESQLIREVEWQGRRLVIKSSSDGSRSSLRLLSSEICNYRQLNAVAGKAVPRLVAWGLMPRVGMAVVQEEVGRAVRRVNGEFIVGGTVLSEKDVEGIRRAAVQSLRQLHSCDCAHGDVQLRHLRVESVGSGWQAWWVDLSMVHKGGWRAFEEEVREVHDVFNGGDEVTELVEWGEMHDLLRSPRLFLPDFVEIDDDSDGEG